MQYFGFYTGPSLTLHHSAFGNDQCLHCPEFVETQIKGSNHCDNMDVVNSILSGRSWDSFQGSVVRNIWLITATHNIELTVFPIPARKTFLQTRCHGGMGEEYQGKWLANCFNSRGVR